MDDTQNLLEQYPAPSLERTSESTRLATPEQFAAEVMVAEDDPSAAMEAIINFQPTTMPSEELADSFFNGTGKTVLPSNENDEPIDSMAEDFFSQANEDGQSLEGLNSDELATKQNETNAPTENDFLTERLTSGELEAQVSLETNSQTPTIELVDARGEIVGVAPQIGQAELDAAIQEGERARAQFSSPEELELHAVQARLVSGELKLVPKEVITGTDGNEQILSYKVVDSADNTILEPTFTQIAEHGLQEAFSTGQSKFSETDINEEIRELTENKIQRGVDVQPNVMVEERSTDSSRDTDSLSENSEDIPSGTDELSKSAKSKEILEELKMRLRGPVSKGEGKAVEVQQDGRVVVEPETKDPDSEALLRIELEERFNELNKMSIDELMGFIEEETKLVKRLKELISIVENSEEAEDFKIKMLEVINKTITERVEVIVLAEKQLVEEKAEEDKRVEAMS